jgi:hypothetical protein
MLDKFCTGHSFFYRIYIVFYNGYWVVWLFVGTTN